MRRTLITILTATISLSALAQKDVKNKLDNYFRTYRPAGQIVRSAAQQGRLFVLQPTCRASRSTIH